MSSLHMEVALFVPWGEGTGQLTGRRQKAYSVGSDREAVIWTMQPIRFCVDRRGNFHLMDLDEDSILSYAADGRFLRRLALEEGSSIVDFLADGEQYFLLRNGSAGDTQLECLGAGGQLEWVSLVLSERVDEADQILLGERIVGVTSGRDDAHWLRFDRKSGLDAGYFERNLAGNCSFLIEEEKIMTVVYDPSDRSRYLSVFDPATGEEVKTDPGPEWQGPLATVFGATPSGELYLYTSAGRGKKTELVRMGLAGEVAGRFPFFSVLPSSDLKTVFAGTLLESGIGLRLFGDHSGQHRLELPPEFNAAELEGCVEMSHAGTDGEVEFDLLDNYHGLEARLGYRPEVKGPVLLPVEEEQVISRMDGIDHWQVGGDGQVYIPVTMPHGLALVRVSGL